MHFFTQTLALIGGAVLMGPAIMAQNSVTLTASVPSPIQLGTPVTFTAESSMGTTGRVWYRFIVRSFDQRRLIARDFSPLATFEWAPSEQEGFYAIQVDARDGSTGQVDSAIVPFTVLSNAAAGQPTITPTVHPLVYLYSAPACPVGATMSVRFQGANMSQQTPAKRCDGIFSMNFYIAGLRPNTAYSVNHVLNDGSRAEGPGLTFETGDMDEDVPAHTVVSGSAAGSAQPVLLGASLFSKPVATDLDGNVIWYYPKILSSLTHPERGGLFFGIDEVEGADESAQTLRLFDLAGVTIQETNAARINEFLEAKGKPRIGAFHHEARYLSNGQIVVLASVERIMEDVQDPGPVDILGDMILVLNRDLEPVWTWNSFDHLDVARRASQWDACSPGVCPPLFLAAQANDWLHGNAVSETQDGNLLYSSRSQDWVIKIDYQNGEGSGGVLWKLGRDGDFSINTGNVNDWFTHQHDPEFESDTELTVFDNGNVRQAADPNAHSRGQVLVIDEAARKATVRVNADLGYYSFALGSAQKLSNGNYFFDAGFRDNGRAVSVEVTPAGSVTYSIESSAPEYRTFRMRNMYTR